MAVFILFGAAGLCLHQESGEQKKNDRLAVKNKQAKRYAYMDGIRTLAAVMVIMVHVTEPLAILYPSGSRRYFFWELISAVLINCNVLFVMMSGTFLLEWKEEGYAAFFIKRFLRVIVPLLVYGVFYERFCCISDTDMLSFLNHFIHSIIGGNFIKGPHLWLVYVICSLYIIVIPLRYMLKTMSEPAQKTLTTLILLCLSAFTFETISGQHIGLSVFPGGWTGIFLIGYLINQAWMRRYDAAILIAGAAALMLSAYLILLRGNCMDIIANQSILSASMSSAIFVLLLRLNRLFVPIGKLLAVISRYSYSILLIHFYMLIRVVYNGWFDSGLNQWLQAILPIIMCLILSTAAAWFIDRFVTDVILEMFKIVRPRHRA